MNKTKGYTFDKSKRYITRGVNAEVPLTLQIVLWNKVDKVVESNLLADYLQVFIFEKIKDNTLRIHHSQEVPVYRESFDIPMASQYAKLVGKKIYIIDDVDHSTMLFADEY